MTVDDNRSQRFSYGKRITVVEDSKESQGKFRRILQPRVEMQIITSAPFFDEKIEKVIGEFNPDLIILDMSLMESTDSGFRVLRQLKKSKSLKNIPVVLCSKSISRDPDDKYKKKAKNLGAVAALPKFPFPDLNEFLSFAKSKNEMQALKH